MNKTSLKQLIKKFIEEDAEVSAFRKLAQDIRNEIVGLGREYNLAIQELYSLSDVKKVNINEFPQIAMMLKQLYLEDNSYEFKKIFDTSNDITFVPNELAFNEDFLTYLESHPDEVLIKFITSSDKEFLIFISPVFQVEYIWELSNEEAEEEPEESNEDEDEDEEF